MAKRPFFITLMASIFLLIPPAVVLFLYSRNQGQMEMAASAITLNVLVISIGTTIVGLGLWRVKPWGFFSLFIFAAGVIGYNMFKFVVNSAEVSMWDVALLVCVTLAMGISLRRQISAPYFNPKMRWWERADRVNTDIKAAFQIDGQWKEGSLLDISYTGLFAEIKEGLQPGDLVQMKLQFAGFDLSICTRVIRVIEDKGVGFMFTDLTFKDRREVKKILKYLAQKQKESAHTVPA